MPGEPDRGDRGAGRRAALGTVEGHCENDRCHGDGKPADFDALSKNTRARLVSSGPDSSGCGEANRQQFELASDTTLG